MKFPLPPKLPYEPPLNYSLHRHLSLEIRGSDPSSCLDSSVEQISSGPLQEKGCGEHSLSLCCRGTWPRGPPSHPLSGNRNRSNRLRTMSRVFNGTEGGRGGVKECQGLNPFDGFIG